MRLKESGSVKNRCAAFHIKEKDLMEIYEKTHLRGKQWHLKNTEMIW